MGVFTSNTKTKHLSFESFVHARYFSIIVYSVFCLALRMLLAKKKFVVLLCLMHLLYLNPFNFILN